MIINQCFFGTIALYTEENNKTIKRQKSLRMDLEANSNLQGISYIEI